MGLPPWNRLVRAASNDCQEDLRWLACGYEICEVKSWLVFSSEPLRLFNLKRPVIAFRTVILTMSFTPLVNAASIRKP